MTRERDADPRTHRVVVGILLRPGEILLCHRHPDRSWYPDVWDFPGGHLEPGETAVAALRRELREELGVDLVGDAALVDRWRIPDPPEDISFHAVAAWRGEPANLAPDEHDELRWCSLDEALSLRLPDPAYRDLIRGLPW